MLSKKEKEIILKDFQNNEKDTGSAEVQIALLTKNVGKLTEHLKVNAKDFSSKRGLLMMVGKRRRLLSYLHKHNKPEYEKILKKLKLKNKI